MLNTNIGTIAVSLLAIACCATPANAEMLIVEVHQTSFAEANFEGEPKTLGLITEVTNETNQTRFEGMYDPSDVGMTFFAPEESLPGFEAALTATTGRFWLTNPGSPGAALSVDEIWDPPPTIYQSTVHAPKLGFGLSGYKLTAVSHTIEQMRYYTDHVLMVEIGQTIGLWGEPIPEPASTVVVVVGLVSHTFGSRRVLGLLRSRR
jgi:hypothetical protein